MTMPGETFSALVREVWAPTMETTIFWNDTFFNPEGGPFTVKTHTGGTTTSVAHQYSVSTNVGTYQYDDAMVEPFTSSQVRAYFNLDHYQEAVRTFNVYKDYLASEGTQVNLETDRQAMEDGVKNLTDLITTSIISDLETWIDASGNFSDGALSRATYDMASYEESTSTALTLAHMEDAVEALETRTSYGNKVRSRSDLLWLMPRNQLTNLSRLVTGAGAGNPIFTNAEANSSDGGRVRLIKQFEEIDIKVIPDMTTTVILLVHKPDIEIVKARGLTIKPKEEKADTNLWQLTASYTANIKNPKNHAKLSAKTA